MEGRSVLVVLLLLICTFCIGQNASTPQRLLYFPDTGRGFSALDPGQDLLQRNLLISNQAGNYNVSFSLSFDQERWSGYALGPRYSSIFNLYSNKGCYIRVRTQLGNAPDTLKDLVYFLVRGKCYSVYWNARDKHWDIMENACRNN